MIVALAYAQASQKQAEALLEWIAGLGHYPTHTLVLASETLVHLTLPTLSPFFGRIERFGYTDHMDHFPESSNLAFQQCALYVATMFPTESRWLYLEPDCVPTRASWLDDIEKEAQESGKPFVGPRVAASPTQRTPEHMAGVAVYPVNLIGNGAGEAMIAQEQPWPAAIAKAVLPKMAVSKLICHDWEQNGLDPSFALYHPDRTGAILQTLSGGCERPGAAGSVMVDTREAGATDPCPPSKCGSTPPAQNFVMGEVTDGQGLPDILGGIAGTMFSKPWENRLETEERIKWLVGELKSHCTRPAYTSYIRSVLAYNGVTVGRTKLSRQLRRRVKKGLKGK